MSVILACGEGPHDIGKSDWSASAGCHVHNEGWVQPILRKALGGAPEIKSKRLKDITLVPTPKLTGLAGHGRRAALAKFIAKVEGCDRVVFVADADTNDTGACMERLQSILAGFRAVQNGVAGTACVPQSTSESWLMADRTAWFSVASASVSQLPTKSPERLWGSVDDPDSNHPKHVFKRVCDAGNIESNREIRLQIAEATDLNELARRCPESVTPFLDSCQNPV